MVSPRQWKSQRQKVEEWVWGWGDWVTAVTVTSWDHEKVLDMDGSDGCGTM
jgi:hypothetical protein